MFLCPKVHRFQDMSLKSSVLVICKVFWLGTSKVKCVVIIFSIGMSIHIICVYSLLSQNWNKIVLLTFYTSLKVYSSIIENRLDQCLNHTSMYFMPYPENVSFSQTQVYYQKIFHFHSCTHSLILAHYFCYNLYTYMYYIAHYYFYHELYFIALCKKWF